MFHVFVTVFSLRKKLRPQKKMQIRLRVDSEFIHGLLLTVTEDHISTRFERLRCRFKCSR